MLSACDASSRRLSIFLCKPWIGAQCILQVVFLEVVVICTEITANFFLKPKFCGFVLSTGLFVLLLNDDFFFNPLSCKYFNNGQKRRNSEIVLYAVFIHLLKLKVLSRRICRTLDLIYIQLSDQVMTLYRELYTCNCYNFISWLYLYM